MLHCFSPLDPFLQITSHPTGLSHLSLLQPLNSNLQYWTFLTPTFHWLSNPLFPTPHSPFPHSLDLSNFCKSGLVCIFILCHSEKHKIILVLKDFAYPEEIGGSWPINPETNTLWSIPNAGFRVPDLAKKTIGYQIKFKFQINNIFCISIFFAIFGTYFTTYLSCLADN